MVAIPVTAEVAEALRDDSRRRAAGDLVSRAVRPGDGPGADPLEALLASLPRESGMRDPDDAEVAAEVRAARAERRP